MTSTVACVSTYENNIELNAVFMTQACSASLLINISTWRSVDDCAAISWWRVSKKEVPHERQLIRGQSQPIDLFNQPLAQQADFAPISQRRSAAGQQGHSADT
jgi:hypothetical protein